ncbi:MAG TPA: hypothetical protein VEL11_12425 [Candidatus Bathyarchaeia archaeon]|nr:hypothetical protein [Candidatus Bathyarchaeia archaeon]
MGRLTTSFRPLYEGSISELKMELQAVDLGRKSAFDLLLKEGTFYVETALPLVCRTGGHS